MQPRRQQGSHGRPGTSYYVCRHAPGLLQAGKARRDAAAAHRHSLDRQTSGWAAGHVSSSLPSIARLWQHAARSTQAQAGWLQVASASRRPPPSNLLP